MKSLLIIRAGSLYLPISCALLLAWLRRPRRRQWAGILLACAWNASALLAVNLLARKVGWWHFDACGALFFGMPVELYLGWVVLWGMLPELAFPRESLITAVGFFALLDLLIMPRLWPVLRLGEGWWRGEVVALLVALTPAVVIARWTGRGERLYARATMQFLIFLALTLWLLPSAIFAALGQSWPAMQASGWFIALQFACLAGAPGVAAVYEFAVRGGGTPLPYDPPARLVTSGPYAYVANPMQMAAAVVLVAWGIGLRSWWVGAAGVMAHIYSAGLARWDEGEDLGVRFGETWREYRRGVRNWIPRWRPYVSSGAVLYVSESCGMCSQVKHWFERRGVAGLEIRAAETYCGEITRITYAHPDGTEESGVAAVARAVEHIHLGWAYVGWCARLPLVKQTLQMMVDASGGEGRRIAQPGSLHRG